MLSTKDRLSYPPLSEVATDDRQRLVELLEHQADNPLGNDPFNSLASQALAKNDFLIDVVMDARNVRHEMDTPLTLSHATHLATVEGPNWVMMKRGRYNYPYETNLQLKTPEGWEAFWEDMTLDPWRLEDFKYALIHGNSQRTEISRGVTFPHIVHKLFADRPITAVDYGCSANWVWSHLASRDKYHNEEEWFHEYQNINDHTGVFKPAVHEEINLERQIGVDRNYPFITDDDPLWFFACRHIKDVNASQLAKTRVRMERYKNLPNVDVVVADLMDGAPIPEKSADIITMSYFLYQMPGNIRKTIIEDAHRKLKDDGVLVINEFCCASPDGKEIEFLLNRELNSTVITGPAVDNQWLEVAQYESTACTEIYPGMHFDVFESLGKSAT